MDKNDKQIKSVWTDIAKIWGRIAGVIAAVGVLATFITKVFNTSPELTYSLCAALGAILLIISFYVDQQTSYIHQEIVDYEAKARKDFVEIMLKARQETLDMKEDSNNKIQQLSTGLDKVLKVSEETRKDTVRIQLLMILKHQPDNIDTILKIAELYFVKLRGDWYMTTVFNQWAKEHDITLPLNIYQAINAEENQKPNTMM